MAGLSPTISPSRHQDPEWGVFPAEQYLIRHWSLSSTLSPDEQRLELVRAFTQADFGVPGTAPLPPPRTPTDLEIRQILEPWRPQKLRRIAYAMLLASRESGLVILRTYYGKGSDELMEEVIEDEDVSYDIESRWGRVLDDVELFGGFADDWAGVLDVLPELVGHCKLDAPRRMPLTREQVVELVKEDEDNEWDPMSSVHLAASCPWPLLVADQEALEDKALQCLWLDGFGNVVRESFLEPQNIGMFMASCERGARRTQSCWQDPDEDPWLVKVGPKYKPGGEMALKLYPAHLAHKGAKWGRQD